MSTLLVRTDGHPPLHYPANHQVGMRVPKNGSDCAKCEYVRGNECSNKLYVKWNKSHLIPAPIDEYCCDFFEAKE